MDEEEREAEDEEQDEEEQEAVARPVEGDVTGGMAWRRETVVGAVYTATGETHFVHRSGIYRRWREARARRKG